MVRCIYCWEKVHPLSTVCPHCKRTHNRGWYLLMLFLGIPLAIFLIIAVVAIVQFLVKIVVAIALAIWAAFLFLLKMFVICCACFVCYTIIRYFIEKKKIEKHNAKLPKNSKDKWDYWWLLGREIERFCTPVVNLVGWVEKVIKENKGS
ncbi:hypothetical protein HDR61_00905 [bacterium]|nr:hypothetical protein [bacterium]